MTSLDIARFCEQGTLRWTNHIIQRLFQRNIRMDDVRAALTNGEIIEQYPGDSPFPSCLLLGRTAAGQPLHVVCGSDGRELWLITAYIPNLAEWAEDYKQRRQL